jgi:hypothetical protein
MSSTRETDTGVNCENAEGGAVLTVDFPTVTAGDGQPREGDQDWPPQVDLILSAIETGQFRKPATSLDRRTGCRVPYRVRACLRLFSDTPQTGPHVVYTRDVHVRGIGFITPQRLPLGHGGLIELPAPDGGTVSIHCTLLRCREAAPGWYEGAVYFNRDQPDLVGQ